MFIKEPCSYTDPAESANCQEIRWPAAGDDVGDDAGTSHPSAGRLPGSRDDASIPAAGSSVMMALAWDLDRKSVV